MQTEEYNRRAKELVDYITEYLSTIRERRVTPDVRPGYMRELLPGSPPSEPEDWDSIFQDIERVVMPGVVHWQSPHMHAYYPSLTSCPSMLGDMLADAINCIGFTWASSPACTELEMNVMDWLCKALGLPSFFLHHSPQSTGGGVLQSTVSESTLVALLAARKDRIHQLKNTAEGKELDDSVLNSRLVAYASDQAHSSVEKAGLITLVKIRFLPTDDHFSLRGTTLRRAIQEDRRSGLVPIMLCATLGTTGVCAFDNLSELGPVCAEEGLWLHVDAAYAGSAYVCPELRWSLAGIEYAHSFVFNPSKWMMVHFDCTAFWVKDKYKLLQTFAVDPVYLRHENSQAATDFMHWQIPLSRRFRSLKLWFVLRSFGLKNLQGHIRHGIEMAKLLESLVRSDPNFEVPAKRHLGLVVFCLKGGNSVTQELLRSVIRSGTMYLIPAHLNTKQIIRFTVTSQLTTREDILRDWGIISKMAADLLLEDKPVRPKEELLTSPTEELQTEQMEELLTSPVEELLTSPTEELLTRQTEELLTSPTEELLTEQAEELLTEQTKELLTRQTEELLTRQTKEPVDSVMWEESEILCGLDNRGFDSGKTTSPAAQPPGPEQRPNQGWAGPGAEPEETAAFRNGDVHVELWIDKERAVSGPRRTVRSLSCSSDPLSCTVIGPISGCNSTKDSAFISIKEPKLKPLSSISRGGLLFKIPEKSPGLLGKQTLSKLTKFYSVPSFYQLWVHCGRYQLCCPLKGPQIVPECWSSTSSGLNGSAGLSPAPL